MTKSQLPLTSVSSKAQGALVTCMFLLIIGFILFAAVPTLGASSGTSEKALPSLTCQDEIIIGTVCGGMPSVQVSASEMERPVASSTETTTVPTTVARATTPVQEVVSLDTTSVTTEISDAISVTRD